MDETQEPIRVGDFVRVTAHDFLEWRGIIDTVTDAEATVRFVIFGRDCGTRQFPTRILERVETVDPPRR
jgi:hypothetical protein